VGPPAAWMAAISIPKVTSASVTVLGGTRPRTPTMVGAGNGLPLECTTTEGAVSSVVVRLALAAPPGRNSATRPATSTPSPTNTAGLAEVNTNSASEVPGSASAFGSCR
jgi:hypothetical protein